MFVINDAGSGGNIDGGNGTPTGEELIEPDDGGPTGELPPVTSVSNLDPVDVAASRFLAQATFGATPATIAELKNTGFEAWIDEQMSLPVSLTEPYSCSCSQSASMSCTTAGKPSRWKIQRPPARRIRLRNLPGSLRAGTTIW